MLIEADDYVLVQGIDCFKLFLYDTQTSCIKSFK